MSATFRYGVVFRKDTDSAFETYVPIDHEAKPNDIEAHFNDLVTYARVHVSANHPHVKLGGYSPHIIIHNLMTIKRF